MRKSFVSLAAAVFAAAAFTSEAQAQSVQPSPVSQNRLFSVTPYAGYMVFGDYLQGPLGTSISSSNAPVFGAQVGVAVTPSVSIVGNFARSSGDLRLGAPIIGGVGVGSSTVMMYDAGIQLSTSLGDRTALPITPFVQVGAGGMTHELSASILTTKSSNFAFNAGVGADVAIGDNVGLRLMAKDYVGRFDAQEASGFSFNSDLTHNWKLGAGLTLRF